MRTMNGTPWCTGLLWLAIGVGCGEGSDEASSSSQGQGGESSSGGGGGAPGAGSGSTGGTTSASGGSVGSGAASSGGQGTGAAFGDVPGPDTDEPFPIDRGDDGVDTPGSYKGLPLRLTDNGQPTVTAVDGVIGMVCIGMSNSNQECADYMDKLDSGALSGQNGQVVVVNCAVGGNAIENWNNPDLDAQLWDKCIDSKLSQAGISIDQVRVVYHKAANQYTAPDAESDPYPPYPADDSDYQHFYDNLTVFAGRVVEHFPSLQAVYITSRSYGGFALKPARGEPLSYEEGHALNQWLVDHAEVDGVWHGWGPYIWAPGCDSGETNASGVCYEQNDFQADGVHPSTGARDKISEMIHARFMQHDWYVP